MLILNEKITQSKSYGSPDRITQMEEHGIESWAFLVWAVLGRRDIEIHLYVLCSCNNSNTSTLQYSNMDVVPLMWHTAREILQWNVKRKYVDNMLWIMNETGKHVPDISWTPTTNYTYNQWQASIDE